MFSMKREEQMSFANAGFERYARATRRAEFLIEMDTVVPWDRLCALIAPHYPTGEGGRPPIPLERMLRIYFLQQWFNLSDPGVEESLYDSVSMRAFAKIDLGREPAPDETTVCKFRHLLERHGLGPKILHEINAHLAQAGVKVPRGTIVDATIIHAPSSTKNSEGKRDPEMHQTMKGNEWHFGMKAHIGVDSKERIVHSVVATPANTHDSRVLSELLHGDETRVWGDSAYRGQTAVIRSRAPHAADFTVRCSARRKNLSEREREIHRTKSRVRARVEHVFHVVKRIFGFSKVRYRGIAKNAHRLIVNFALANLYLHRRRPTLRGA
ncbi:MAG: IS5-like element ISPssy family transposase [Vulcanimicrobiaceae bacterium]